VTAPAGPGRGTGCRSPRRARPGPGRGVVAPTQREGPEARFGGSRGGFLVDFSGSGVRAPGVLQGARRVLRRRECIWDCRPTCRKPFKPAFPNRSLGTQTGPRAGLPSPMGPAGPLWVSSARGPDLGVQQVGPRGAVARLRGHDLGDLHELGLRVRLGLSGSEIFETLGIFGHSICFGAR
jgi:hypothetical protein